jgi:hypothetical protein
MKTHAYTETEALEASRRTLLAPGWTDGAVIREAEERTSARSGNEMIELDVDVPDGRGGERMLKDYLTSTSLGELRLRRASEAVGALARYNSREISASDFPGHTVRVKIGVEKKRGYAPRNIIEDYAVSEARVVSLREVAS